MTTARWACASRRLGLRGLVAASALMLAAMVAGVPRPRRVPWRRGKHRRAARRPGRSACTAPGCSTQGNQVFVSYGLTVPGLQVLNWRNFTGLDLAKIAAAAVDWCANTVRLQLSQDNLLGPNGTGFDQSYLTARPI